MIKKEDIKQEHIETAFKFLNEYCEKNNLDVYKFVKDKKNIEPASEEIHKNLSWTLRMILSKEKICSIIKENHDFIVDQAKQQLKLNKKKVA